MSTRQPFTDLGGAGPVIHFAHGNGFPPGTYAPLAATLTDDYRVVALPSRPLWPESQPESAPTWRPMADDLVRGLDELHLEAIIGLGHSLGGVLTLWAAIERPGFFRAVVLIEPVILPPTRLWLVRFLRALRQQERLPLVKGAKQRRKNWPSRQACFEHFRAKALFARWSDTALLAYVTSGTRELENGAVTLAYPPHWEAHIFATVPAQIWRDLRQLPVPALVIRGDCSTVFVESSQSRMGRALPRAKFHTVPGAGHLVPMERPEETGEAISAFLRTLEVPSHSPDGSALF
jgi:pimeloyl-ACP methyl ester carboxylesterase